MGKKPEKTNSPGAGEILVSSGVNFRSNTSRKAVRRTSLSTSSSSANAFSHFPQLSLNSRHALEEKEEDVAPRKVQGNAGVPIESKDVIKNVIAEETRKKPLIKLKSTAELKAGLSAETTRKKLRAFLSQRLYEMPVKPAISLKQNHLTRKRPLVASKLSRVSTSGNNQHNALKSPRALKSERNSEECSSPFGYSGIRKVKWKNKLGIYRIRVRNQQNNANHTSGSPGKSPRVTRNSPHATHNSGKRIARNTNSLKLRQTNASESPRASSSPKPLDNGVTSLHPMVDQNLKETSTENEIPAEKTLYVIEPIPAEKNLEHVHTSSVLSPLPFSPLSPFSSFLPNADQDVRESESQHIEANNSLNKNRNKNGRSDGVQNKSWRQKSVAVHPEQTKPQKSKFQKENSAKHENEKMTPKNPKLRQGEVVDESFKNPLPDLKKLKLKKGRKKDVNTSSKNIDLVCGEDVNHLETKTPILVESMHQGFQDKKIEKSDVNASKTNTPLVELRYQGLQDKKEEIGLLNELIEKRANKLAETKKSNLKTLVGPLAELTDQGFKDKKEEKSDAKASKIVTPLVELRHQGFQDKKEEIGLLNDVIKKTANKLAKTKKNRVKALVGAFETAFSVQEI